jgi:hypothetical protein
MMRAEQAGEHPEEGALTGAIGTEHGECGACPKRERYAGERLTFAIAPDGVLKHDGRPVVSRTGPLLDGARRRNLRRRAHLRRGRGAARRLAERRR